MRRPSPRLLALAAAVVAAVVVALVLLADGDDGGDAGGRDSGAARAPASTGAAPASADERAAAEAVLTHFRAIRAGDGAAACATLSPAGRRALAEQLGAVGDERPCEQGVLDLQVPELRVERVRVAGERATVVLAGGLEYEVERVGGAWKLSG